MKTNGEAMKYPELDAGEWIEPKRHGYLLRCCDCSLVHRIDFRVRRGRAQFRVFRENVQTRIERNKQGATYSDLVALQAAAKGDKP